MKTSFIVEQRQDVRKRMKKILEEEGYRVCGAVTAAEAEAWLKCHCVPLYLIDLDLPNYRGIRICRQLRERQRDAIIIGATASRAEEMVGRALESGVNDCICKNCEGEELKERLRRLVRLFEESGSGEIYHSADIMLDMEQRRVLQAGEDVELTNKEFELFAMILLGKGKVLRKEELLQNCLDTEDCSRGISALTAHIANIRRKLMTYKNEKYIETKHGQGYCWKHDVW